LNNKNYIYTTLFYRARGSDPRKNQRKKPLYVWLRVCQYIGIVDRNTILFFSKCFYGREW